MTGASIRIHTPAQPDPLEPKILPALRQECLSAGDLAKALGCNVHTVDVALSNLMDTDRVRPLSQRFSNRRGHKVPVYRCTASWEAPSVDR